MGGLKKNRICIHIPLSLNPSNSPAPPYSIVGCHGKLLIPSCVPLVCCSLQSLPSTQHPHPKSLGACLRGLWVIRLDAVEDCRDEVPNSIAFVALNPKPNVELAAWDFEPHKGTKSSESCGQRSFAHSETSAHCKAPMYPCSMYVT